jgi:hypothetical protein
MGRRKTKRAVRRPAKGANDKRAFVIKLAYRPLRGEQGRKMHLQRAQRLMTYVLHS